MELIDRILEPIGWIREIFVWSIVAYTMLFFLAALGCQWLFLGVVRGARLEASSARVKSTLQWVATRIVQTSYGGTTQNTRLPNAGDEHMAFRLGQRILRRLCLKICEVLVFISALPRFFLSGFGMAVLVAPTLPHFLTRCVWVLRQ